MKSDALARRQGEEYLQSLAQRLRMWRLREGKSYFSMPTALWDEAVGVARKIGPGPAARALGLNRDDLLRRMNQPASAESVSAAAAEALEEEAEFAELPGVAAALTAERPPPKEEVKPAAQAAAAPTVTELPGAERTGEVTVHVTGADGARLTVQMPAAHLNIQSLIQQFRGAA